MNKLLEQGFKISQNVLFTRMLGRAGKVLATPVKVGMLLTTAYGILTKDEDGSGKSGFEQVKDSATSFIRLVKAYISGAYRDVPNKTVLLIVGALIYLVSPLDLIPDFIPGLGFLDDISLITWMVSTLKDELDRFERWEIGEHFTEVGAGHS